MSYALKRKIASALDTLSGFMLGYFIFDAISIWLLLLAIMAIVIVKDEFL